MKKISLNEIFMYSLGALVILGFFVVIIALMFCEIPTGNKEALYLALGAEFGAFTGVVGYFYGSSAGSKQKTDLLSKQNNNALPK